MKLILGYIAILPEGPAFSAMTTALMAGAERLIVRRLRQRVGDA